MAIRITEDGTVIYENEPDIDRELFPNLNGCCAELRSEIDELKKLAGTKAAAIYETASGEIASFSDGADDMSLKSCVVNIEPIQEGSGDPSPENVRPISGRTGLTVVRSGKNLLYNPFASGSFRGLNIESNNSAIHVSGTYTYENNNVFLLSTIQLKAGSYKLSGWPVGVYSAYGLRIQIRYNDSQVIIGFDSGNGLEFALASDSTIDIRLYINGELAYNKPVDVRANMMLALSDSEYDESKGSTYSVNWESEAGVVYGGYVDVVSGKLTVDRANIASYNGETLPSTWISDRDVYVEETVPTTGAQVVYRLAEPVEYQLASQEIITLLGENNIWSDAGGVDVEYPADTKMYIEKLTTPTEDDMISDHEISANSFFMVGNTLYRAITSIASGATITPGTNAMKLSLSDALNALA